MTENEALEELKTFPVNCLDFKENQALQVAIKALSEIKQYRAIGTVEELIKTQIREKVLNVELESYKEIGTIEEFKALKEKSEPKKPIYSDFDNNGYDEIIPYKAICPICGNEFEFESWNEEENHHCICGQKLNWQ